MTDTETKVRENRLRRAANRQGLALTKSRRRDPRAYDFGTYTLTNSQTVDVLTGATLDEVEQYLSGGADPEHARRNSN